MSASKDVSVKVRRLRPDDLERTIAIDQAHTGRPRRRFFQKRLDTARSHPEDFIHVGVTRDGVLVGFAFARVRQGEFGRDEPVAALDLMGVDPSCEEHGYGHLLMEALMQAMREKGVRRLHSQADWTEHGLLKFFASHQFKLAPRLVLERSVAEPMIEAAEEA
ncbi:MAG: GNAT family N-acetyltransferase [Rhodoplanes sp.]|jgi:GNAT superfamily N-acetyltransferase